MLRNRKGQMPSYVIWIVGLLAAAILLALSMWPAKAQDPQVNVYPPQGAEGVVIPLPDDPTGGSLLFGETAHHSFTKFNYGTGYWFRQGLHWDTHCNLNCPNESPAAVSYGFRCTYIGKGLRDCMASVDLFVDGNYVTSKAHPHTHGGTSTSQFYGKFPGGPWGGQRAALRFRSSNQQGNMQGFIGLPI